jgi:four helix bundle protein
MEVKSHRDLLIWQKGMDLVADCYRLTAKLPDRERFGLSSQIQRAAVSIPANIAEGFGRQSTGAYLNHLSIASGSLAELETLLRIAVRLGFLIDGDVGEVIRQCDELGRMMTALKKKLTPSS